MKIRTKLSLNNWISASTFIIMLAVLAWSLFESSRTFRDLELINELRKIVAERVMLRDDYLLYREERAKIQWQAKSETFRGLLDMADARFAHREDKALLKEARKAFEATFTFFSEFLDKHKRTEHAADKTLKFTDAEARLINQVFLKAYVLTDNIMQLHKTTQKKAKTAREREGLIIVLFLMGGIVATIFNTKFIGILLDRKIAALTTGVDIIGNGNLDYRIEATGNDELSNLARASNEMADRLKKSYTSVENLRQEITERKWTEAALKTSEARYRLLSEHMTDSLWLLDMNFKVIYQSPSVQKLRGFTVQEVMEMPLEQNVTPESLKLVTEVILREIPRVEADPDYNPILTLDLEYCCKDGTTRWTENKLSVIRDENSKPVSILNEARDITERKLAEEEIKRLNEELDRRVIERTTQLEAVNKELETFSYSVSHDLRAPLRSIDGFSHALLEDYQGKLDATGKSYLERICKATQHMGNLIDDMLKLSRVTQSEFNYQSIDLSKMVQSISDRFQKNNPNNNVKMTIQKGIVIQGDPHSMQIALTNLIDNAWKFTGKQKHPRIEFGATLKENEKIFFIRDNGVGFDMSYVGKLFGAFQRLHTIDEFAGTGIGLVTVQRIIRRHGGKIWAEGEVGKGATFYFTLP